MSLARFKPSALRLLLRVAETGKLQLAAEMLAISQPAASRILAEVETEIGAPIFERLPRGMLPTDLGTSVLRRCARILAAYEDMDGEISRLRSGQAGKVRIGAVTGPAVGYVMPALRRIWAEAPDIEATVHVAPSVDLVRGLEERHFDFIIARLPIGHDATDLDLTPARSERVALLVRRAHPLAGQPGCSMADLRGHEWVMQERGAPIRQAVENAFSRAGLGLPGRVINSSSLLVALAALSQGDAITPQAQEVVDLLTHEHLGMGLVTLDVAPDIMVEPYFIIRHRHHTATPAVAQVYQHVLAHL
ncbi:MULTISPECIES: LysR family transcriptional regulator [unclassified Yoonia]|uniref:LysR family transcriptional regulator n=1 Tax=unclassified Yoonia TaxID=2629118 RepID=UPI002AFED61D|nr:MULTISPECIES: LysR family transcriptional regulator [unclassified Yoonia]